MPSKIPAAYAALLSILRTNLPGVEILDGPSKTSQTDNRFIMVGVSEADGDGMVEAISGHQAWAQLGGKFRDETFSIHCNAVGWNGDGDQQQALADAFSLFDAVGNAVVSDPSMGGSILYPPGLTSFSIRTIQDGNGCTVQLPFDVECRTRI